jgi:hypothetical protein
VENNGGPDCMEAIQEVPLGSENHSLDSALTARSPASTRAPHSSMLWDLHLHLSANTPSDCRSAQIHISTPKHVLVARPLIL